MTNVQKDAVKLWEKYDYFVIHETNYAIIMRSSHGDYLKIDKDGMVVPFTPLNENIK